MNLLLPFDRYYLMLFTNDFIFAQAGGIRQQFSLPENIKMSMYGIDFIKNSHELKVNEDQDVDVQVAGSLMTLHI